jgi:DNA-binding FadR family transcriptional regulator
MLDAGLLNPSPRLPGADPQIAQAVRRLRIALVRCEIEPGQFVAEQEIAERFGLGRAAVRVALTALEVAGLVTRRPRQGWRAAPITDELLAGFGSSLRSPRSNSPPPIARGLTSWSALSRRSVIAPTARRC